MSPPYLPYISRLSPYPYASPNEVQQQERELLQHSLSALYASMGAKEQELARAHAGRRPAPAPSPTLPLPLP